MLYIMSQMAEDKYLIFDTEDNMAEPADLEKLQYALSLGIKIKGVMIDSDNRLSVKIHNFNKNSDIAKLKLLLGVNIEVSYTGGLTYISFENVKKDISINLSDYCLSVCNYAIRGNARDINVTLIFDDSIRVDSEAFKSCVNDR